MNIVEKDKSTATVYPFYVTQPIRQSPGHKGGTSTAKMVLENN